MPTPFRTAPIVQKSAPDGTKSLIHGFRLRDAMKYSSVALKAASDESPQATVMTAVRAIERNT